MPGLCTRRDFVAAAGLAAAAVGLRPRAAAAALLRQVRGERPAFRLGAVVRSTYRDLESFRRGVELGFSEAAHAARMFGNSVALRIAVIGSGGAASGLRVLAGQRCDVAIGGLPDVVDAIQAIEAAGDHDMIYLNAACAADVVRGAACGPHAFHVCPSEAMRSDAVRQAEGGSGSTVVAWHPELHRYGAEQLNDRFTARYGTGMDEQAWTGWMSGKIAWESFLRGQSAAPDALAAFLRSPRAVFDGHKGVALRFSSERQLSQPLYVGSRLSEIRAPMHTSPAAPTCGR